MMFFGGLAVSFIGKGMLPQSAQDFMSENQLLVFGTRLRCNIMPLTLTLTLALALTLTLTPTPTRRRPPPRTPRKTSASWAAWAARASSCR